jgi:N6-adenosine-specific RNA methylase IME4
MKWDRPFKALKGKRYGVILADPPWKFIAWGKSKRERGPGRHYKTLDLATIKALPVGDLAADDCVLLLWIPDAHLREGFDVLDAWGFTFKTVAFYWAKLNKRQKLGDYWVTGMGYWTRANPEQCWLATRGKPKRLARNVRRLIVEAVREHSRKPTATHGRIERLLSGPYVELFTRHTKPGWDCWGDQTEKFEDKNLAFMKRWGLKP